MAIGEVVRIEESGGSWDGMVGIVVELHSVGTRVEVTEGGRTERAWFENENLTVVAS